MRTKRKIHFGQIGLHIFFVLLSLCYIFPLLMLLSVSLEGNPNMTFSLFPREFTLKAYRAIFADPSVILRGYAVTGFYSVVGTLLSLTLTSMISYSLARRNFKLRKIITFLLFFTCLFSGGMVPSYIVNTQLLHLNDTIWIYILPGAVSAWNVIVIRTYFQQLPAELFESAHMDGASELRICFRIAVPLSTPVLASVGFMGFIAKWNDWSTTQVYIRKPELRSLQYLLKLILDNIEQMQQMFEKGQVSASLISEMANAETMRFAMAVVAAGPMLFIFPFFQKYFAKGMILGSVKG